VERPALSLRVRDEETIACERQCLRTLLRTLRDGRPPELRRLLRTRDVVTGAVICEQEVSATRNDRDQCEQGDGRRALLLRLDDSACADGVRSHDVDLHLTNTEHGIGWKWCLRDRDVVDGGRRLEVERAREHAGGAELDEAVLDASLIDRKADFAVCTAADEHAFALDVELIDLSRRQPDLEPENAHLASFGLLTDRP